MAERTAIHFTCHSMMAQPQLLFQLLLVTQLLLAQINMIFHLKMVKNYVHNIL